jgi:hypothetical protein
MTKVNKPVSRETHATVRDRGKDREVCVTIDRTTVTLRLKGTQQSQTIAVDRLYNDLHDRAARLGAGM